MRAHFDDPEQREKRIEIIRRGGPGVGHRRSREATQLADNSLSPQ
jgi:hypothetical protein